MQQTAKIFIATPCYGGMVTQEYKECVTACTSNMQKTKTLSLLGDDAVNSSARNTLPHQC